MNNTFIDADSHNTMTTRPLIILCETPDPARARQLQDLLQSSVAASGGTPRIARDIGELEREAAEDIASRVAVIQPAPQIALATELRNGAAPDRAIRDWCNRNEAILAFFRRNRYRTILIEESAVLAEPETALSELGLTLPPDALPDHDDAAPVPDPVEQLLGDELLRRDAAASTLAGEIEASTTVSDQSRTRADLEAANRTYADAVRATTALQAAENRATALERQLAEGKTEQDAILAQLLQTQEMVAKARTEKEQLEDRLTQMRQGLESSERQIGDLQADRERLQRENAEQTEQGEKALKHLKALRKELDGSQDQVNELQAERDRLRRENSTQAGELEDRDAKINDQMRALREGKEKTDKLEAEMAHRRKEIKARFDEIATLTSQLQDREAEIMRILASKSIRITAPLRRLRAAFGRTR